MIPPRDLSLISNELLRQRGGRRIPDQTIELDYALGWFLSELAQHPFSENLAFKGGTALRRCHIGEYRFSEDLDFTLLSEDGLPTIRAVFDAVGSKVEEQSGMTFRFDRPDPQPHQNSHTFYMTFTGPMRRPRDFKVDVTKKEKIVHQLERKGILRTYDAFDFPEGRAIKVYSINETVAEKLLALTDPQRSQPRDLYDLWYLNDNDHVDLSHLADAVAQKLAFRGRSGDGLEAAFNKKEATLKRTWKTRLDPQMAQTPEFETVMREVRRAFRQSNVFELVAESQKRSG